jgi:hypothetical protein
MQKFKTQKFLSDWGLHLVLLAVTLPIVGLAYLSWIALPAAGGQNTVPLPPEEVHWLSGDVIRAFQDAGLEAEVVRGATKEERDGLSAIVVADTTRFRLSANPAEMGIVFCFNNLSDLQRMKEYYEGLNHSLPRFRSWLYVKDNILLQINGEVPEEKARAYAQALDTLEE